MKFYLLLSFSFMLTGTSLIAQNFQNGSIVKKDKTTLNGRIYIDNENEKVLIKKEFQTQSIAFDQATSVIVNGRSFSKTEIDNKTWFANSLVSGETSLFKISEDSYIISKKEGISKLIDKNDTKLNGILAVIFNDCNTIREQVLNKERFNQSNLIAFTTNYNNCVKNGYAPTEEEIKTANRTNSDLFNIYVGAGIGINNLSFFDSSAQEDASSIGLNIGIMASPAFLGSMQGNLFFEMEGSANLASDNAYTGAPSPINFSNSTYRLLFDLRYQVNKKGKIQPFVGAGIGFTGNRFKGTYEGLDFNVNGGTSIFRPKAGVVYNLKNNKSIGLTVSYIPQYENDISFQDEDSTVIPLRISSEYINAGLFFYF